MENSLPPIRVKEANDSTKKTYVPPKLENLGSFVDLTQPEVTDVIADGIDF
jgi:hypothetical protein